MTTEDVIARLIGNAEPLETAGLLFHGTCETFDLPPKPGDYDGVLWTATSPVIAQSYIPKAGISLYAFRPDSFRLKERVWPAQNDFWYLVARHMGFEALDVELDKYGSLTSWRLPAGYPTYEEAMTWLEGQGYRFDQGDSIKVLSTFKDGKDTIRPADWRLPGRLLVTISDGLKLFDYAADKESDLTDLEYHRVDVFRQAEADGFDGIVINDFLQDDEHGNVGHRSVGLFAATATKAPWIEMPATNMAWHAYMRSTPDIEAFIDAHLAPPQPR